MIRSAIRLATLGLLLACSGLVAKPQDDADLDISARADRFAEERHDAKAFLRELDEVMENAEAGNYGSIKAKDVDRVNAAYEQIVTLLKGHDSAMDLEPDQRIAVYNAQETITAILRNDLKGRMVCEKVRVLGSRVPRNECMTVAQREERMRRAKETGRDLQRENCVIGEGNRCTYLNLGGI